MADAGKTKADEAARLEAALERIAQAGPRVAHGHGPVPDAAGLARRLDALIAELRAVLGRDSAN